MPTLLHPITPILTTTTAWTATARQPGQTAQDDTFYYFPRGEAKTLLTARADADPSVLDRLESAYAAYAESHYLETPDGADYGTLQEFCEQAQKEHKLSRRRRRDTNL